MELVEVRNSHTSACRDVVAALNYPRAERDSNTYGEWSFIGVFDDADIREFLAEIDSAGDDIAKVGRLLHEWQMSARTMSDPIAREILDGRTVDDDWVEVTAAPR
jgi:hypothetical protein